MTGAVIAYWVGAAADWYTTKRGLQHGAVEGNPIPRFFMRLLGRDWGGTAVKVLGFVLFVWALDGSTLRVTLYVVGAAQAVAALGNHLGWWTVVFAKIKGLFG